MGAEQENAEKKLLEVQSYNVDQLVRRDVLGDRFAFGDVITTAKRVVQLFQKIPTDQLDDYPDQQSQQLAQAAEQQLQRFQRIMDFDPAIDNPTQQHQQLIDQINNSYQGVFNQLLPHIQYLGLQQQDFASIGNDARAALEEVKRVAGELRRELEARKTEADQILQDVKAIAAEQGVGNQAIHFHNEANRHGTEAKKWLKLTIGSSTLVTIYAIASLFIQELPGLDPIDTYHALQLTVSKVLIFATLAYLVFLSAKNFLSHRHNEIVNRHRQNALSTFKALADATSDAASSDIVLSHAAACIFAPQETGLTKQDASGIEGVPNLQIVPRIGSLSGG